MHALIDMIHTAVSCCFPCWLLNTLEFEHNSHSSTMAAGNSCASRRWRTIIGVFLCVVLVTGVVVGTIIVKNNGSTAAIAIYVVVMIGVVACLLFCAWRYFSKRRHGGESLNPPDSQLPTIIVDSFLNKMEREKPIKFTSEQLRSATGYYSNLLGSGGYGEVYKGYLINETTVAVKVLRGSSAEKNIEQQFMAEVGTIGRTHHFNLVRLYGFCFEENLVALVYEYMENGSLDKFLFKDNRILGYEKLHEIAIGTARGIAYLHEYCQQRIIHYDIKPGNILLDRNFNPKVADFGLAKLCNRENTHITMTGARGTPGYAAPELWSPSPVTHMCDVYSFGMLLFEIIGKRRNFDVKLPESQEWFPLLVWKMFSAGQLRGLMMICGVEEKNEEIIERMVKVALLCAQYRPGSRPIMSVVVKMLEGSVEIPEPWNPFQHLMDDPPLNQRSQVYTTTTTFSSSFNGN